MRTRNPSLDRPARQTRGEVAGRLAGSRGITVRDASTEAHPVRDILFIGATVTDNDDSTVVVTIGDTGSSLLPEATVTTTKDTGNPTFNFAFIPESIVKVSTTYYCSGTEATESATIKLSTATDRDGPWTLGATILTTPAWCTGLGMYAPEIMEQGGTFYCFYSNIHSTATNAANAIGVATSATVAGTYTDSGGAILSPGAASTPTSRRVGEPSVIYHGGQWIMAFMAEDEDVAFGASEKVFIATAPSPTGPWTVGNSGNPVIDFGASGEWDDALVADPFLFYLDGYLWIMYAGGATAGGARPWQQGLASALPSALTSWTRHPDNPILTVGSSGAWDDSAAWRGSVWIEDGAIGGVYAGHDGAAIKGGNFRLAASGSGIAPPPTASDIPIADAGGYYTGTDVEAALQELGTDVAAITSGAVGHYEVLVTGTAPPVAVTNAAEDDWVYGFVED